jgi:hypothetical protein
MNEKEKKDEALPVYEVEFIPVERRLQDRRTNPPSGEFGIERRQYGRRKTDVPPPAAGGPAQPPAADPGARRKK